MGIPPHVLRNLYEGERRDAALHKLLRGPVTQQAIDAYVALLPEDRRAGMRTFWEAALDPAKWPRRQYRDPRYKR